MMACQPRNKKTCNGCMLKHASGMVVGVDLSRVESRVICYTMLKNRQFAPLKSTVCPIKIDGLQICKIIGPLYVLVRRVSTTSNSAPMVQIQRQ